MNNKITKIIEGIVIAALGIIIAVSRSGEALNIYLAIVALVLGTALLILSIITLSQRKALDMGTTILGTILIFIGIFLLAKYLSIGVLIDLLIVVLMGLGTGLVICGIYALVKKAPLIGLTQLVVGVLMIVFSVLYMTVEDFRGAFWIVIGILLAIYGVLVVISGLIEQNKKK